MYRRYTIHRDGDLLVEDLDPTGTPTDPEPVPAEDRLPCEVVLLTSDDEIGREKLLELLEAALELEQGDLSGWKPKPPGGGGKLPILG
jgi:hypothetical protein